MFLCLSSQNSLNSEALGGVASESGLHPNRGCIRIESELHPNRNSCLACSYSLHIHPRDSEPACPTRAFLLLFLLTIYTCKSVTFSQGFLSAARESYAHRNTMSISAEEPHDLYFRVKLLTRLLYRSTTNCQLTTQTDHEHGSALTPQLRTLPYSGPNISNS